MQITIDVKSIVKWVAIIVIAACAGFVGGHFPDRTDASANPAIATTATAAAAATGSAQQQTNPMAGTGAGWEGLAPLSTTWLNQTLRANLKTATGANAALSTGKPILFTAYWCHYCHQTLQTLSQNHSLGKVQVVALGFDQGDGAEPVHNVTTIKQAVDIYQKTMSQINVSVKPNQILYAMPGTAMESQVTSYPVLIVQHKGTWYYLSGYSSNASLYKTILS